MKAPDKIYVNIPGDYWHPGTDKKVSTDTEYVRKDALLEKLSRAKELRLKSGAKESSDGIRVIDALIEMVNEM